MRVFWFRQIYKACCVVILNKNTQSVKKIKCDLRNSIRQMPFVSIIPFSITHCDAISFIDWLSQTSAQHGMKYWIV